MDTTSLEVLLKAAEFVELQQNHEIGSPTLSVCSSSDQSSCSSLSSSPWSQNSSLLSSPVLHTNTTKTTITQPISFANNQFNQKSKFIQRIESTNSNNNSNNGMPRKTTLKIFNDSVNDLSRNSVFISKLKNIDISKRSLKLEELQSNEPMIVNPNDNAKSPSQIYSTSPSSFSCSSSNSSLFSLSNMGYMNNSESDKCDLMNDESMNSSDTDKYKPEDIKRNKMIHNILEKNRRAHLKDCFENLQAELPDYKEKKVTNLLILKQTIKYLEQSKRIATECENELNRLLSNKSSLLARLNQLKSQECQNPEILAQS